MIPARHHMDSIDAAWLRMDKRTNPMIINGVWVLDGRLKLREFKRQIRERFLVHGRFRQVPVAEVGEQQVQAAGARRRPADRGQRPRPHQAALLRPQAL